MQMIPSSIHSDKIEEEVENQFVVTNKEELQRFSEVLIGSLPHLVLHLNKMVHTAFSVMALVRPHSHKYLDVSRICVWEHE